MTQKAETSIGFCWMQDHRNWCSAVDPRALEFDFASNRRLPRADEAIRHTAPSLDAFWRGFHPHGIARHPRKPVRLTAL